MLRRSVFRLARGAAAVAATVLLCRSTVLRAEPVPWSGNDHWYDVVYVPAGISWTEANLAVAARHDGGYLVSITSTLENDFVYSLIRHDERYWVTSSGSSNAQGPWIGAYQTDKLDEPAGHWAWTSGEPWGYTNWSPGEPNNWDGKEDYGMFFGSGVPMDKTWNDSADDPAPDMKVKAYIVEYNQRPMSAEPPATVAAEAEHAIAAAPGWDRLLLGSWALIGVLLAGLVGMAYLWNRARTNAAR